MRPPALSPQPRRPGATTLQSLVATFHLDMDLTTFNTSAFAGALASYLVGELASVLDEGLSPAELARRIRGERVE